MKKEKFLKECAKKGHDVEKCKEFIDRHVLYEVNMKILEDHLYRKPGEEPYVNPIALPKKIKK